MLKPLVYTGIALISLIGLALASAGIILLNTPRATNLKGCLVASMNQIRLCPKDANYVRLDEISESIKQSVIISEDAAFYGHKGLDWHELKMSFETNLERGRFARGGSTITQQLAKNLYLTAEKSLLRKAKEAILAMQIEKSLTKGQILEKYLNVVEFGPEVFGIKAAARYYFSKNPSEITLPEAAFLAFLLPNPKKYSVSFTNKQLSPFALRQMTTIITRLLKFQKISQEEHDQALTDLPFLFGGSPDELSLSVETPEEETEE